MTATAGAHPVSVGFPQAAGGSTAAASVPDAGVVRLPDGRPEAGTPPETGDDLRRCAGALVRTMVEVLSGRRTPAHMAPAATPAVIRYLMASRTTGAGAAAAPRRVHVSRPGPDAAEVVAVCRFGSRFRAIAVRLDRDTTGSGPVWQATAVRLV